MKKFNIVYNNEDAILKVKDESLIIVTNDNDLIKIPYDDIKGYNYNEKDQELTIEKHVGKKLKLLVARDVFLFEKLSLFTKSNKTFSVSDKKDSTRDEIKNKVQDSSEITNLIDNEQIITGFNMTSLFGYILMLGGIVSLIIGIVLMAFFFNPIGLIVFFVSIVVIVVGRLIIQQGTINKLFSKGSIIGKNVKYIENIIGEYTSVDVSNNDARVYKWDDRLEIICDKNNVCKEVLKRN